MEELQPLGIVHIGGNLVAHLVDIHLPGVQLLQHVHGLGCGIVPEVATEEGPHAVQLCRMDFAIGLHDCR